MSGTFRITTLGCKVNQYESACLRGAFLQAGWVEAPKGGKADASIVNTCIVTQSASNQSRQAIRRAIKENPGGLTAAVGCYVQVFPKEVLAIKGLDLMAGNRTKHRLPDLLRHWEKGRTPLLVRDDSSPAYFNDLLPLSDRTRALLKVQDGCDSFCSYCIVPFARGPLRSLEPEKVLENLRALWHRGYHEVVLTGIHLGRYGVDLKPALGFKDLLRLIAKQKPPLRIRLSSMEPTEIGPEIIEMVASEPCFCRHFHISLQNGNDITLQKMNRRYTALEFRSLIEAIHARVPVAAIGVDVIAGFPGEDKKAHLATYRLLMDLPLSYFHVFPFSPRKGTRAWSFPERIPEHEMKERTAELRALGERKRQTFYKSCIGSEFEVLSEGWYDRGLSIKGLSDNYLPVVFDSSNPSQNEIVPVRIERVEKKTVHGKRSTA
ncbi:MAG: tRNA (N(6)-L-threonylcarbamoyladenosine(37)-C(2))-methylthiotransferase MtaB [Deltaproteobacteria bacterium]|nr:tRNA (N(6)-L-threonylcarbamoyladenosine(37)-C(2))-methylthiotransferase MtaB [Deltaproteobacteria bacterium]